MFSAEVAMVSVFEVAVDSGDEPPVSYTHLDVYKRQVLAGEMHIEGAARQPDPVRDHRDLCVSKPALLELVDRFLKEPGSSGLTLGRPPATAGRARSFADVRRSHHERNPNARQ